MLRSRRYAASSILVFLTLYVQEYVCDERMATATFTTEQGELRCRFVNVDFDVHATWSSLGLAVVAGHPGYTTTRSIGLRHWRGQDFGGLAHKLPELGSWLAASKAPPGKFMTVPLGPVGALEPTFHGCPCGKVWTVEQTDNA